MFRKKMFNHRTFRNKIHELGNYQVGGADKRQNEIN